MTGPSGAVLGTEGSATATIAASNVTVEDLTFANTYNPAANPAHGYSQAVALNAMGDRMIFRSDRFLGLQDTLLAWQPTPSATDRQLYENSFIEGNVDFLFGDADAVFYADTIKLEDRGAAAGGTNGYLTASATASGHPYGFLIASCTISSSAAASTFYLGRPWHPYAGADPQVVVRDTYLPAQIKSAPWTTMSGFSFSPGRYGEYRDSGPGSGTGSGRPQLTSTQAASYTAQAYLAGNDGWAPLGATASVPGGMIPLHPAVAFPGTVGFGAGATGGSGGSVYSLGTAGRLWTSQTQTGLGNDGYGTIGT